MERKAAHPRRDVESLGTGAGGRNRGDNRLAELPVVPKFGEFVGHAQIEEIRYRNRQDDKRHLPDELPSPKSIVVFVHERKIRPSAATINGLTSNDFKAPACVHSSHRPLPPGSSVVSQFEI